MKRGNMIASTVVFVWGAAILIDTAMAGGPQGEGAYRGGQTGALVFAVVLVVLGAVGVVRELTRSP
jgi:hypothetical protein